MDLSKAVLIGQPRKVRVAIARLTYGQSEHPAVGSWLAKSCHAFLTSKYCGGLAEQPLDLAPVFVARNAAVEWARRTEADYLVMVDADSIPDVVPNSPPFFETALKYAIERSEPCLISAPVPMVNDCVNVHEAVGNDLLLMPLEVAKGRMGFQRADACGMGLILFDMRVFQKVAAPYFAFNFDADLTTVVAGEDVGFTARCIEAGVPVYVAFDSWCGHRKAVTLGSPR